MNETSFRKADLLIRYLDSLIRLSEKGDEATLQSITATRNKIDDVLIKEIPVKEVEQA